MTERRADQRFGTIPRMAVEAARQFGTAWAVIDGDVRLTFEDVAAEMRRVAKALVATGVSRGDRVALWAPNSAAWITGALGVLASGAWLVPVNTRFRPSEAAHVLERADAHSLLVVERFLGTDYRAGLEREAPGLRALERATTIPPPASTDATGWTEFLRRGDEIPDAEVDRRIAETRAEDVCDIIFTSGTTGAPKGVMLRHGASLRCYESYNLGFGLAAGDTHMVAPPFFHCFGYKAGWMLSLMVGATTIPLPVFDAEEAMTLIQRHRVSHMPGAPTMYDAIVNHPSRVQYDLSSLESTLVSSASIPESLVRDMREVLGVEHVMTGYGLTENHALGSFTVPDDPPCAVTSTTGRPAPDVVMRIVGDDGREMPAGEPGEVLIGGYALMSGYYQDPEATAAVLVDGWLKTGDIGTIDEKGYLRITDRKKDMYVMGGFNVAPAEVEGVLRALEDVEQVAVVGIPDDHFGEVGAAFVVPTPGAELTEATVLEWARDRLANFKVPRRVVIVDALPLNATGKVLKDELRHLASEGRR